MNYIAIALVAWVLSGLVSVMDRFMLERKIPNPAVYTFYASAFALFAALIFLPFARFSTWPHLIFDLALGAVFLAGLYFLFKALAHEDVSEAMPISGALTPLFSLILVKFGLHIGLSRNEWIAFILMVAGTILISVRRGHFKKQIIWPILASLCFALYYTGAKLAYTPFAANFSFVRIGQFLIAPVLLLIPSFRRRVFSAVKQTGKSTSGLYVGKEILAGISFIVLNYAISLGNPAIVNAMQGIEYVVIFLLAFILATGFGKILKEDTHKAVLIQRFAAILLIIVGIAFLQFK